METRSQLMKRDDPVAVFLAPRVFLIVPKPISQLLGNAFMV